MLLSLRNDAKRNRHELTLVAPPPPVRRIFEITGTRGLFRWRIDHSRSEESPQQAADSAEHASQQADDAGEQTSHHAEQTS